VATSAPALEAREDFAPDDPRRDTARMIALAEVLGSLGDDEKGRTVWIALVDWRPGVTAQLSMPRPGPIYYSSNDPTPMAGEESRDPFVVRTHESPIHALRAMLDDVIARRKGR
jgi:hypothetical protein